MIAREGNDGAIICSGICVHFALEAVRRIRAELGADIRVGDMHTIKPIDKDVPYEQRLKPTV